MIKPLILFAGKRAQKRWGAVNGLSSKAGSRITFCGGKLLTLLTLQVWALRGVCFVSLFYNAFSKHIFNLFSHVENSFVIFTLAGGGEGCVTSKHAPPAMKINYVSINQQPIEHYAVFEYLLNLCSAVKDIQKVIPLVRKHFSVSAVCVLYGLRTLKYILKYNN